MGVEAADKQVQKVQIPIYVSRTQIEYMQAMFDQAGFCNIKQILEMLPDKIRHTSLANDTVRDIASPIPKTWHLTSVEVWEALTDRVCKFVLPATQEKIRKKLSFYFWYSEGDSAVPASTMQLDEPDSKPIVNFKRRNHRDRPAPTPK